MSSAGQFYIRGSLIPNYNFYCPITKIYGGKQTDGTFSGIFHGNDPWVELEINEKDVILDPGFLVIHIGSIEKDYTVETAAEAIFNSLRSLFAVCDIPVDFERFRTTVEFSEYMKMYRSKYSHVILIGHGQVNGIEFLDKRSPISGVELSGYLGADACQKKVQIISLCCHSGCASLAKYLSQSPGITEVLAPNDVFDMRWAVHFVTGYLLFMYINGVAVDDAVAHAAEISGKSPICVWRNGSLAGQCKP